MPNRVRILTVPDADRVKLERRARDRRCSGAGGGAGEDRAALGGRPDRPRDRRAAGLHRADSKWRRQYAEAGLAGLEDAPRPGGPSQSAISRIWRAFELKPHLIETWKLSADPQFIEKVRDVVGLYLDPPEQALVLCVDEKSQIQPLDRTAPCLPILPATPARRTHDYVRNGTTSLFAALEVASGSVIAQPYRQHRHQEFLRFLKLIDDAVPKDLDLHLILDNYATHKTPEVKKWLLRHPRFHLHFTPTSSSWLNLVERWFAELTRRKLRRSAHRTVTELEADLRQWTNAWNKNPKPFTWTKAPEEIFEAIAAYCKRINDSGH